MIVDLTERPLARLLDSRYPLPILPTPRPAMVRELFFTGDPDTFGVRYDDDSECIVANTEANRSTYGAMVEYYRERMDALAPWRD